MSKHIVPVSLVAVVIMAIAWGGVEWLLTMAFSIILGVILYFLVGPGS